jgi:hypothetical protein
MDFIEFGAPNPSRCQEVPCRFALRGPCEFGHHPAFTGKFSEFVRWVHLVILPKGQIGFLIQRAPSLQVVACTAMIAPTTTAVQMSPRSRNFRTKTFCLHATVQGSAISSDPPASAIVSVLHGGRGTSRTSASGWANVLLGSGKH